MPIWGSLATMTKLSPRVALDLAAAAERAQFLLRLSRAALPLQDQGGEFKARARRAAAELPRLADELESFLSSGWDWDPELRAQVTRTPAYEALALAMAEIETFLDVFHPHVAEDLDGRLSEAIKVLVEPKKNRDEDEDSDD